MHLCTAKLHSRWANIQARRPWGDNSFGHDRDCPSSCFKTLSISHCQELMVLGVGATLLSFFISYIRLLYIVVAWYGAVTIKGPKSPFMCSLYHTKLHYRKRSRKLCFALKTIVTASPKYLSSLSSLQWLAKLVFASNVHSYTFHVSPLSNWLQYAWYSLEELGSHH